MTTRDQIIMWLPRLTGLLVVTAVGACAGSLINVLVYRMPRGLSVVTPPSRCPHCDTRLTWRENIPIFGWLLLRGRCRFCKSKISPEYPIVEAIVAVLIGGLFALWYVIPADATMLGFSVGQLRPEWAVNGIGATWPAFLVTAMMIICLVAMTIIDARTFTIPLVLAWIPAIVALVVHTGHAAWFEWRYGSPVDLLDTGGFRTGDHVRFRAAIGEVWTLATPGLHGWKWIGGSIGAMLGLAGSGLLLKLGLIRQSFADYEAWEAQALAEAEAQRKADPNAPQPKPAADDDNVEGDPDLWIQYPHARREMFKELAFLGLPAALAWGGAALAANLGGTAQTPLWLTVLSGVLLGYLVGGGVVWAVRIFGSLGFGKEAMGLGDVHLMAGVGACLGWIDPVLAFFGAAFVGLAYAIAGLIVLRRLPRALPYGPFLAVATLLVLVFKPQVETLLGMFLPGPIDLP